MKLLPSIQKLFLIGCFVVLVPLAAVATHLRAGEITATRLDCSLTFRITVTAYVNTGSTVLFGSGGSVLEFGDGDSYRFQGDGIQSTPVAPGIGVVKFEIIHTYKAGGSGFWIRYYEPNRNAGILNITESVNVNFFLETLIQIDPFIGCDNSPRLLTPPVDKACSRSRWQHNPGAYDPDGDSLSYKLIAPQYVSDTRIISVDTVPGYRRPNAQAFYKDFDYNNAQQDGSGKPTFYMDPKDGTITWDAPGQDGEYNIAFIIFEWRKVNNVWQQIGYIIRDMQILVEKCDNLPPIIDGPADICVIAGEEIPTTIFNAIDPSGGSKDPGGANLELEIISEILFLDVSKATYAPRGSDGKPVSQPSPAQIELKWKTECAHIKQQPYLVVVKVTEVTQQRLSAFHTLRITVTGPSPEWNSITPGANRSALLNWKPYDCVSKADSMQIWRRIDSIAYTPECKITGMPASLGYEKIRTVAINQTSFTDTNNNKGLPPGAVVCYRLVATFPPTFTNTEGGTESLVSDQACLGPIVPDAPVMTRVSIDTTSRTKGEISVQWTPPFKAQNFTLPYHYKVFRAVGFSGTTGIDLVKTKKWPDGIVTASPSANVISLIDSTLNTADNVYNYRVMAFDANDVLVDTSAVASSVRLQAKSLLKKIELTWTAEVPWSLQWAESPKHYIYRGDENQTEGQFVLIDSIFAANGILQYTDAGTYHGEALLENKRYCYRVETRGGYGFDDNSKIPEPLINFSQIVCAQPSDMNPPCKPDLVIDVLDCDKYFEQFGCAYNDFSNVLRWPRPTEANCLNDISHYRIYYSNEANADTLDYKLLVDLADRPLDTSYVDRNLPSFARCYRLRAVDRSGNESAFSEEACNDNCPNYHLPNVFTPGNDDCNDFFSAYSDRNIVNGILNCSGGAVSSEEIKNIRALCPRFVQKVDLVIVDRWGKTVFTYSSGGENSIFIDWDGRDNNGKELNSGTYFYNAKVVFDALRPKDREKNIKGWVQLVRGN